jgi:hypothetical protein
VSRSTRKVPSDAWVRRSNRVGTMLVRQRLLARAVDHRQGVDHALQALDRQVLGLHRDHQLLAGRQGIDHQHAEQRRAVDHA